MDIVSPLPKSRIGCEFILKYIDMASRWPEAVPQRIATTQMIIIGLTSILSRNGFPRVLITDNGPEFTSKALHRFCSRHEINKIETASYRQ